MSTSQSEPDTSISGAAKDGNDLLDMIGQQPTLDRFLDRNTHATPLTDDELRRLIVSERMRRATIDVKLEARRDKHKEQEEIKSEIRKDEKGN